MASRNSGSDGGGCLASIVVFFVLFFLPAWVTGDDFGWGVLIVWWIILGAIIGFIVYASSPSNSSSSTNNYQVQNTYGTQSQNNRNATGATVAIKTGSLKVGKEQSNISLLNSYNGKLALKAKLEQEVEQLEKEQQKLNDEINDIKTRQQKIRNFNGKPFLMTKKKYLSQKQPEIIEMDNVIGQKEKEHKLIEEERLGKQQSAAQIKYHLYDESNEAFEKLKKAIDTIKKSCYIKGTIDLKNSSISSFQRDKDLKYVQYNVQPYGILLDNYRFYIFPTSIWVFEEDGKLAGIFKPKAITGTFEFKENIKYSSVYLHGQTIYEDTKIITKDIPHTTWLHTCRDGSPDLRYSYNPSQTYYTKQDYYLECSFELGICGCKLKYEISSYDNCELLESAISAYAEIRENKDIVPIVLDLLERCTTGNEVKVIKECIAKH